MRKIKKKRPDHICTTLLSKKPPKMAGQTAPQRVDQLTYPKRNAQVEAEFANRKKRWGRKKKKRKKKSDDLNGADKRKSPTGGAGEAPGPFNSMEGQCNSTATPAPSWGLHG